MMCLSLDGKLAWEKDSAPSFHLGAMALAGGLILSQNGANGDLHLVEPNPKEYRELAKVELFSLKRDEPWAPLALSDGKLLVRNSNQMICLDLQNP